MRLDPKNLQQLAALLTALMSPEHFNHDLAVEMAQDIQEAARQERIKRGQAMMQEQIDNMDADELTAFHRAND